jgi:hypothetical protein
LFDILEDLQVSSATYECLFFRQNGGDSLHQVKGNVIPQRFNTPEVRGVDRKMKKREELLNDSLCSFLQGL